MKTVYLDVFVNDRFVCQLPYKYHPILPLEEEEVVKYIISKRPTLRNKKINVSFSNNRVF